MPALWWWCLVGCPIERPDPSGTPDSDAPAPDTDGDTDPVFHRPDLEAVITYPAHGDEFDRDDTVYLEGEAHVGGEVVWVAEFRWTSSLDGFIGEAAEMPWSPQTSGEHVLELEVRVGGTEEREQIDVIVFP